MSAPRPSPFRASGADREPGDVRSARTSSAGPEIGRLGDRSVVYGGVAALVGAAVLFALAGPLSVDTGLLVAGAAVGWVVGIAVRSGAARVRVPAGGSIARMATAIALVLAACAVAWMGTWAWSHVQGGVLGPADFFAQAYGLLVPAQLLFATAGAAIGSR